MDGLTHYLTTDLDIYSDEDLTALAKELESKGFAIVRPITKFDREWFCGFSLRGETCYDEPEPHIFAMLTVIEGLTEPMRSTWAACTQKLFDIGYNCGREPLSFRQELSAKTLARLAEIGSSLRITLYADRE